MERDGIRMNAPGEYGMLLNLQMIADSLEELYWEYTLEPGEDRPRFRCCQVYWGQEELQEDAVYLVPEELESGFPADQYSYIACGGLRGRAPHIRGLHRPVYQVMNLMVSIFQKYHDFENQLNQIVTGGGTLVDLCRAGSAFFQNPIYIHDNLFSVIALSSRVEGMLKFEYNEKSGKLYIPLWLIDEFKYDESYQKTLSHSDAGIWDNEQYPYTMRSLYVNLRSGDTYYGRLLINELGTRLQPGQFRVAEYLGQYAVKLIQRDEADSGHRYWGLEDTFIGLMKGESVDNRDLQTTLNILGWSPVGKYLCMKLCNQDESLPVKPDKVLDSALSLKMNGSFSFRCDGRLCIVVDQTQPGTDLAAIRQILAPMVRDSCMYVGISGIVEGIRDLKLGFRQADIALDHIFREDSSQWILSFEDCALAYIRDCALKELPAELLVDNALAVLRLHDRQSGTEYYKTLRQYLLQERNIPQTAEALIIHRTTLTYRLQKIQQLLKIDLDDPDKRLYLLLSFYLMDHAEM